MPIKHLPEQFANKLVDIAIKQYETSVKFKKGRLEEIRKNEEFYQGRKIKVPKGRFAVPLPVMSGFVDTLMSKIDDPPVITYGYKDIADLKVAQKVSAAWQIEKSPRRGNWAQKDRWAKKLACFSGRATFKIFAESDPKYRSYLEVVDHEDFHCEPMGGGDLEKHLFCGQDNIFRTKADLIKSQLYEPNQVNKLVKAFSDEDYKRNEDLWRSKSARLKQLGLDLDSNTYVGQPIYRFVEWVMDYEGEKFYLLFEYSTKIREISGQKLRVMMLDRLLMRWTLCLIRRWRIDRKEIIYRERMILKYSLIRLSCIGDQTDW